LEAPVTSATVPSRDPVTGTTLVSGPGRRHRGGVRAPCAQLEAGEEERPAQVGPAEVSTAEVAAEQVRLAEVRVTQVRADQQGSAQVGVGQVRVTQVLPGEVTAPQVRTTASYGGTHLAEQRVGP